MNSHNRDQLAEKVQQVITLPRNIGYTRPHVNMKCNRPYNYSEYNQVVAWFYKICFLIPDVKCGRHIISVVVLHNIKMTWTQTALRMYVEQEKRIWFHYSLQDCFLTPYIQVTAFHGRIVHWLKSMWRRWYSFFQFLISFLCCLMFCFSGLWDWNK